MAKDEVYSFVIATFPEKDSAEYVYNTLLDMQNAEMVDLKTASTVYRDEKGKLEVHHKHGLTTWKGAAGGVAVGFLLGGPILGGAIGALIGRRGKGEQRDAKEFLDDKLGQNESAIIVYLKDADWIAVRDMFRRFDAEALQLELSPEAEEALSAATADEEAVKAVRAEVEIVNHPDE